MSTSSLGLQISLTSTSLRVIVTFMGLALVWSVSTSIHFFFTTVVCVRCIQICQVFVWIQSNTNLLAVSEARIEALLPHTQSLCLECGTCYCFLLPLLCSLSYVFASVMSYRNSDSLWKSKNFKALTLLPVKRRVWVYVSIFSMIATSHGCLSSAVVVVQHDVWSTSSIEYKRCKFDLLLIYQGVLLWFFNFSFSRAPPPFVLKP